MTPSRRTHTDSSPNSRAKGESSARHRDASQRRTNESDTDAPSHRRSGGRRHPLVRLQRNHGNQAIQRLTKRRVQPKLEVGLPDDKYEREAEAAAGRLASGQPIDRVSRLRAGGAQTTTSELTGSARARQQGQDRDTETDSTDGEAVEVVAPTERAMARSGAGSPLAPPLQPQMEAGFGVDFSEVRVHTDAAAHEATETLTARALTQRTDIYLARDESVMDRALLAHELTHVVQQRGPEARPDPRVQPAVDVQECAPRRIVQADLGDFLYDWDPLGLRTYTVAQVIQDDDPGLVERLTDQQLREASDSQSLALIRLIHRLRWVGPSDETRLELLWNSMDDLPRQANENFELFKQSIEYGAELEDISTITTIKERFESDVERQAIKYLRANLQLTVEEQRRLGLDTPGTPMTAEQRESVQEIQRAAETIKRAQDAQSRLREIPVGIQRNRATPPESFSQPQYVPVLFDPERPPRLRSMPGYPEPEVSWEEVKTQYDRLTALISGLANRYPGVYALTRGGRESLRETAEATTEEARALVGRALNEVQTKINEAFPKLESGDIEY